MLAARHDDDDNFNKVFFVSSPICMGYNMKELKCFTAFCFHVVDVWNEVQFFVKYKSEMFMLVYK